MLLSVFWKKTFKSVNHQSDWEDKINFKRPERLFFTAIGYYAIDPLHATEKYSLYIVDSDACGLCTNPFYMSFFKQQLQSNLTKRSDTCVNQLKLNT